MKILQITPSYLPRVGGIAYGVDKLSKSLVQAGHEVTIFTSRLPNTSDYEEIDGLNIYRFYCLFQPMNNPFMPLLVKELLSESSKFDIIHAHSHFTMTTNIAAICKKIKNYPLMLTSHGASLNYSGAKGIIERIYQKTFGKWTINEANKIIAPTLTQHDILLGLGAKKDSIVIIPNGIDINLLNLSANTSIFRESLSLHNRQVVLFVGTIIPRKGLECLVKAMYCLKQKPLLLIVGPESRHEKYYMKNLKNIIRARGLSDDIKLIGPLDKAMLELAYLSADVFVLPSSAEGLPAVLLEAMSYKKCVIASNIPGISDVINDGENGVLFDVDNYKDLSNKLEYLLNNEKEREKLGINARREIENSYTWDIVLSKTISLYQEVLRSI